jgi:hypothetical protein
VLRSPAAWAIALYVGVLIHVDWHLGRPGHSRLSFDLANHWLLAIAVFAPLPWVVLRRWPSAFAEASTFAIGVGVLLGQGLEPLGEVIYSGGAEQPFMNDLRWRVFGEFVAAGILTYVAAALAIKRGDRAGA